MVGAYIGGHTPIARGGATDPPAAPMGRAQRSPEGGATGPPCRPLGGRQAPLFSRDLVANLKKKITLRACRPIVGRPGDNTPLCQYAYQAHPKPNNHFTFEPCGSEPKLREGTTINSQFASK